MPWPSSDVPTTGMDAGTDPPPRSVFLAWAQAFNQMRNHVTTFMQGLLTSADAAAARATLDVPSRAGGNATGTWGIGISGNASTATTATNCSRSVTGAGLASGGGALTADRAITVQEATTLDAQNGTGLGVMTARRTAEAIAAQSQDIGVGQTWQNVLASRAVDTTYQNTTGRTISVYINLRANASGRQVQVSIDGLAWLPLHNWAGLDTSTGCSFAVPAGWYYRTVGTVAGLNQWMELR